LTDSIDIFSLENYIHFIKDLDTAPNKSFTEEELSGLWNLDPYRTKTMIRKLRKAGFIRRTRSGRYKITFAGLILVRVYKRAKKEQKPSSR